MSGKPKPTRLRVIQNNPSKRPLPKKEPQPKPASEVIPEGLSKSAKKHWGLVSKQLLDARILTDLDIHALSMYCESYATYLNANEQIQKYGPIVKAPSGYPVQSPYLSIANKAFDQMKSILIEFGMTPSSRTRIQTTPEIETDEYEGL